MRNQSHGTAKGSSFWRWKSVFYFIALYSKKLVLCNSHLLLLSRLKSLTSLHLLDLSNLQRTLQTSDSVITEHAHKYTSKHHINATIAKRTKELNERSIPSNPTTTHTKLNHTLFTDSDDAIFFTWELIFAQNVHIITECKQSFCSLSDKTYLQFGIKIIPSS